MNANLPPLRLLLPLVLLLLGALLGAFWTDQFIRQAYRRVETSRLETGRFMGAFVAPQVEAFYRRGEEERAASLLNRLNADRELTRVLLVDRRNRVIYSSRFAEEGRPAPPGPLADLAQRTLRTDEDVLRLAEDRQRIRGAFPVRLDSPHEASGHPFGVLLMEWDLRFLKRLARHRAWSRLWWSLGVLLLLCSVAWVVLHRTITRRLHRLIRATERLAAGEPGARAALAGRDELATVGRALDTMADRLEAAQSDLLQRERRFRQLIEHGTDIIGLIRADRRILFVSPSVRRILGWEPDDFVGHDFYDFVHPDDRREAEQGLSRVLNVDVPNPPVELRMLHVQGHWITVEAIGNSPPEMAERQQIVVNARDISEWKELQDQLRQSQKLKAVGQLAGGIAHDFNNLLTTILGNCDLVAAELRETAAPRENLREIRHAAERGSELVRQLLAFSRRQILRFRELDLNTVVRDLESLLRRTLGERVELVIDLSPAPCTVKADRTQLEQVLMNLALNARQAMPEGGTLEISTRIVQGEELPPAAGRDVDGERRVLLRVRDTGTGIDEEIKDRIFDPFFTTKPVGESTGLGLATVHGIVSQSDGTIWAESVPGEETVFTVSLPVAHDEVGPRAATAEEPAARPAPSGRTVGAALVVEDERPIRRLVATMLEREGYTVLEARSLQTADEVLRETETPLALLVSDIVLPDGSGFEIAARVVADRPETAVVLVSGYSSEMVERSGDEAPYRFVPKPFSAEQLLGAVHEARDDIRRKGTAPG